MKQYCLYCNNLVAGNGIYCEAKNKEIREITAKRVNKCPLFEFNELDAIGGINKYKPRKSMLNDKQERLLL